MFYFRRTTTRRLTKSRASVTGAKIEQWSKDPSNGLLYRSKKNTSKTQETSSGPTDPVPPIPNNEYGRNSHDAWSYDGLSSEFPYGAAFCQVTQESGLTADPSDFLSLWDQEIDTQPYFNRPLELNGLIADNEPARDTFNSQLPQALPPAANTGSIGSSNEPIHPQSTANLGQRELLRGDHNVGQVGQPSADQLLSQGQQTATNSLSMQKEESVVQYLRMEVNRLQNEVETKKRKIQALESRNDQLGRENEKLKVARLMSTAERPEPRYDQLGRQSESVKAARLMSPVGLSKLGDAAAPTTPVPRQRLNTNRNAPGMPRRNAARLQPASRQSIYRYPSSSQGSMASWQNISSPAQHTSAVGDRSSMATSPFNNHTISSHSDTPFSLLPEAVGSRRNSTSSTAPSSDDDLAQASRRRRAHDERHLGIRAVDEWRNGSLPQRLLIRQSGADREEDLSRYLTRLNLRQDDF
jgi:FtsZ-binding cell division protein ZapB